MTKVVFLLVPGLHLIGQGATVEAAARAAGFQDARMFRRLRGRKLVAGPDAARR